MEIDRNSELELSLKSDKIQLPDERMVEDTLGYIKFGAKNIRKGMKGIQEEDTVSTPRAARTGSCVVCVCCGASKILGCVSP